MRVDLRGLLRRVFRRGQARAWDLEAARIGAPALAGLPVFGLALGMSMGARPLDFLLRSGLGLVCLAGGLLLAGLGVVWVERLVDAVEV